MFELSEWWFTAVQGRTGSKNRPWTLTQTGPPEPAHVYITTAALPMHAHSVFDVMLVPHLMRVRAARERNLLSFIWAQNRFSVGKTLSSKGDVFLSLPQCHPYPFPISESVSRHVEGDTSPNRAFRKIRDSLTEHVVVYNSHGEENKYTHAYFLESNSLDKAWTKFNTS